MDEILIDITRLLSRFMKGRLPTGVDRVNLAYVKHYAWRSCAVIRIAGHGFVIRKEESGKLFEWLQAPGKKSIAVFLLAKGLLFGLIKKKVAGCFFINAGHSGLEQQTYPAMLKRLRVRPLIVVHDLIPITHPEYCRKREGKRHVIRMNNVLALASGIISNSQATAMDLQAHAKNVGRLLPPLVNAWLAPGMSRIVPGKRPMDAPYFVILGTIEPRKNHWLMLQLWRGLIEQMGAQAPRLVVIGQRGWECENVVDMLERCKQLNGFLEEHPACSDEQLITFLHHAQALLFPSFAEGFGMPLVEALAHGLPVIASDLPVFREIAGNIPEYIAPLDGKRWSERVIEYAKPVSPLRQAQLRRMEGYIAPTWAEHFAKVDELMEQLNRTDGLS